MSRLHDIKTGRTKKHSIQPEYPINEPAKDENETDLTEGLDPRYILPLLKIARCARDGT